MLQAKAIPGLLGILVLLVGTTAGAMDTPTSQPASEAAATEKRSPDTVKPEMERIVVSLPSGRRYVIKRPKSSNHADPSSPSQIVRVLADGSRISYGLAGGSGAKAVSRRAPAQGGQRASGGGVSRAGSGVSGGGSGGSVSSLGGGGRSSGGGGGGGGGGGAGASNAVAIGGMTAGTAGSPGASTPGAVRGARAPNQSVASQQNTQSAAPVSTIGTPRYNNDQATGGQDVTFFDAGISAMVLGRTVYIWGAEIVQSSESFQLVEGERFAFDGAVARNHRTTVTTAPLTAADQLHAPLKLEFTPGSTTTLTMYSLPTNPELPDRSIRNWTFRVR